MGRPGRPTSLLRASGAAVGVPGAVVMAAWATGSLGALGLYAPVAAYETAAAAEAPASVPDHPSLPRPTSSRDASIDVPDQVAAHPGTSRGAAGVGHRATGDVADIPAGAASPGAVDRPAASSVRSMAAAHPVTGHAAHPVTRHAVHPVRRHPVGPRSSAVPSIHGTKRAEPTSVASTRAASDANASDETDTQGGIALPLGRVSVLSFG